MKDKLWIVVTCTIVIVVVAVSIGWFLLKENGSSFSETHDFLLVDIQGKAFRLSDFRGKIVILDFMATWCGPCRNQIPHLQEVREKCKDLVVIISISIDPLHDSEERLREFLRGYPYADWIWARDTINLRQTYGITAIPTLIIIDQNGYVRFKHVGLTPSSILIEEIDRILKRG